VFKEFMEMAKKDLDVAVGMLNQEVNYDSNSLE